MEDDREVLIRRIERTQRKVRRLEIQTVLPFSSSFWI